VEANEPIVGMRDDVDEGISDTDHVEARWRHGARYGPGLFGWHSWLGHVGQRYPRPAPLTSAAVTDHPYRLPRTISPHRYTLVLEPDLAGATFAGTVQIDVTVNEPTDRILLNADELGIDSVSVDGVAAAFDLDPSTERLTIHASPAVGEAQVVIGFTGTLNDKLRGWYRSTYRDADGAEHVIATSQMQATDCRRAFPCWDEPDFKAVFDVTLVIEPDLLAVSNGAEESRELRADGKQLVHFRETMPMSTYLVAFVVGPLEVTEPVQVALLGSDTTIPLRIVHVPGKGHLTAFGLDVGAAALGWYQSYYGIPYPTDKCDMLALPDFAAGAMENLGCITYRENFLLCDVATSTQAEQQLLADGVTHELAHMWFGDLVTMRWWNGIWLNEAFATFMEIACCDAYRPDWKRWTTFSLERSVAFETDSLASTRSVEFPVEAPADCDGMFDVLTYQKGGALLRMLEQFIGEAEFRNGVNHYLRTHTYGNTETSDLWDAIEHANPATPVRRLMDSWIWQPGYPLLDVTLSGNDAVISQQRFAYGDNDDATLWVVPVHVCIDGVESKVLLDADQIRIALPSVDAVVVVNAGGHGFVRVAYDEVLRGRLTGDAVLQLTTIDRYNLVDDAWNAVVAGRLGAIEFLDFVEGFAAEGDLAVWQAIAVGLRGAGRLVAGDAYEAFRARVRAFAMPVLDELGWEPAADEDDLTGKLRGLLVGIVAILGNDTDAQQRCAQIEAAPEGVHPELVAAATTVVAAFGDDDDYQLFVERFRSATTPQEQLRYLFALAEFPTAELVLRTCELAMGGEVKTQNAPFLLGRCIANREHGQLAWEFVRRHWDEANDKFPGNTIVRMIDGVKLLNRGDVVADVQSFFSEHPIPQAAKTLDQVLERQRVNAALRQREEPRLVAALTSS
jgi:puromycin-sensitive aminopeptidase